MDNEAIKARNYRMVETLRHQNRREQMKLDKTLYSRQGVLATHKYELQEMSKQKKKLRQELIRIRQTGCTTWGVLPPRGDQTSRETAEGDPETNILDLSAGSGNLHPSVAELIMQKYSPRNIEKPVSRRTRKLRKVKEKTLEEQKQTEERLKLFNEAYPLDSDSSPGVSREDKMRDKSTSSLPRISNQTQMTNSASLLTKSQTKMPEDDVKKAEDILNRSAVRREASFGELGNLETVKEKVAKRLITDIKGERSISESAPERKGQENVDKGHINVTGDMPSKPVTDTTEGPLGNKTKSTEKHSASRKKGKSSKNKKATKSKRKNSKEDDDSNKPAFDALKYNPDGSLRTVHKMPDFLNSFSEAKKARYIRNKERQWFEKELSIKDIFDMRLKEKTLVLFS